MFLAAPPGAGGAELCASRPGALKELWAHGRQSALVSERIQYLIGYTRRMMNAAELLEQARVSSGLTQEELARRAGTSRPTLSAYEHGRKSPTVATFARLLAGEGWELAPQPPVSSPQQPPPRGGPVGVRDRLPRLDAARALALV